MQNDFEKKVQQALQNFALPPGENAWNTIEKGLTENKRRRRFIVFWWAASLVFIAGGIGAYNFYVTRTNTSKNAIANPTVQTTENKISGIKPNRSISESAKPNEPVKIDKAQNLPADIEAKSNRQAVVVKEENAKKLKPVNSNISKNNIPAGKVIAIGKSGKRQSNIAENKSSAETSGFAKNKLKAKVQQPDIIKEAPQPDIIEKPTRAQKIIASADKINSGRSNNSNDGLSKSGEVETDTSVKLNAEPQLSALNEPLNKLTPDSSLLSVEKPVTKLISPLNKKLRLGVTIHSGVSNVLSAFPLKSQMQNDALQSSSPVSGSNSASATVRLSYKAAFSAGAGMFILKPVTQRFSVTAGIHYQYYSAETVTGNKVSAQRNVFDTLTGTEKDLMEYFSPSSGASSSISQATDKFINQYHLIQLPVSIQYSFGKKENIVLHAGLVPGLLIGSKALYYDRFNRIAYENSQQLKSFQLALQTGLLFKLGAIKKNPFYIGPQFQYGLTNLSKKVYNNPQHLFYAGVRANLQIGKK